jgi:hypothetical protein
VCNLPESEEPEQLSYQLGFLYKQALLATSFHDDDARGAAMGAATGGLALGVLIGQVNVSLCR